MAEIVKPGRATEEVARYKHDACGALVEFKKSDIRSDRDGHYVVCPCGQTPWISADLLRFRKRVL